MCMPTTLHAAMIMGSLGPNLCVDSQSTTIGTKLKQYGCSGSPTQLFNLVPSSAGYYTITDSAGNCWDLTGRGTSGGTLVEMWTCNGGANQQFAMSYSQAQNGWLIKPFPLPSMCVDITGGSSANGAAVEIWSCNGGLGQLFKFGASTGKYSLNTMHRAFRSVHYC